MLRSFENYNANYTYDRYNYRANVDVDDPTTIGLNRRRVAKKHQPNGYGSNIWQYITCVLFSSPGIVDGHHHSELGDFIPCSGLSGISSTTVTATTKTFQTP